MAFGIGKGICNPHNINKNGRKAIEGLELSRRLAKQVHG
jgi:hypothetical protein